MKAYAILALLAIGASQVLALPSNPHVEHEKRDTSNDHSWVKRSRLEAEAILPVHISLKQSSLDEAHDMLMSISDPFSPDYGKHLTGDQVAELFKPSDDSVESVTQWLHTAGIHLNRISHSVDHQWLHFKAKVHELESLLQTEYHEYEHLETGHSGVACEKYHVPRDVQPHIDFIKPGIAIISRSSGVSLGKRDTLARRNPHARSRPMKKPFPVPLQEYKQMSAGKACDIAVTPHCVKVLYNITDTISRVSGNSIGVYESEGELYSQRDLNRYFATFGNGIPNGTHPIFHGVNGAPRPKPSTTGGTEADLDFQVVYPFNYPDDIVNWQVGDRYYETRRFPDGLYNEFLDAIDGSYCHYKAFGISGDTPGVDPKYPDKHKIGYHKPGMCGVYKPTKVITISYQQSERELPLAYQRRQCNEWMKMGLQGTTILFASGDEGVEARYLRCKKNAFNANTPSGCPYVTSVGGTVIPPGAAVKPGSEIATTDFPSGGGFSNIYPQPKYQTAAVASYLKNHNPGYPSYKTQHVLFPNDTHGGKYNRAGRGYPDIAAIGQNYGGYSFNSVALFAGTSVSTPLIAALIARINNHRMAEGKGSVGFINPTLYANPDMFNDVVEGNNPGCGTKGFSCVPGWDPVTGLGTPNYGKMLDVFMNLP